MEEIDQLMIKGECYKALEKISLLLEKNELDSTEKLKILFHKSVALRFLEYFDEAEEVIKEVIKKSRAKNLKHLEINSLILFADILLVRFYLSDRKNFEESMTYISEAENIIKNLKQDNTEIKKAKGYLLHIKGGILEARKDYNQAKNFLEKSLEIRKQINDKEGMMRTLYFFSLYYYNIGKLEKRVEFACKSIEIAEEIGHKFLVAACMMLLNFSYMRKGEFQKIEEIAEKRLNLLKELNHKKGLLSYYNEFGGYYWRKGELDEAYDQWNLGLLLSQEMNDKFWLGNFNNGLGIYYVEKGKLEKALEYFFKSLKFFEEIKNWGHITIQLTNIGETHWRQGNLDKAIENSNSALAICDEKNLVHQRAAVNYNFGLIFASKGEFDKSLKFFEKAINYYEEIQWKSKLAEVLQFVGLVLFQKGELDNSLEALKNSLEKAEKLDEKLYLSFTLFYIIKVYSEKQELEQAEAYLNKLEVVNNEIKNELINLNYRLSKALFLKESKQQRERIKAEILFEEIANEEIIYYNHTIYAILSLCELYLEELTKTNDISYKEKLSTLTDKLQNLAKKHQSYSLLTEVYWLQSQLALINFDTKKAHELLFQAKQIADERELSKLEKKYSDEIDTLDQIKQTWLDFKEKKAPSSEIIKQVNISETLKIMKKDRTFDAQSITEQKSVQQKLFSLTI